MTELFLTSVFIISVFLRFVVPFFPVSQTRVPEVSPDWFLFLSSILSKFCDLSYQSTTIRVQLCPPPPPCLPLWAMQLSPFSRSSVKISLSSMLPLLPPPRVPLVSWPSTAARGIPWEQIRTCHFSALNSPGTSHTIQTKTEVLPGLIDTDPHNFPQTPLWSYSLFSFDSTQPSPTHFCFLWHAGLSPTSQSYPCESFSLPSSPKEFGFYISFSVRPPTFLIIVQPPLPIWHSPNPFYVWLFSRVFFFHSIWHTMPLIYVHCLSPNSNVVWG